MSLIYRMFSRSAMVLALLVVSAPAFAAKEEAAATHEGKVVSITSTELVMTDKAGKEHSHALTAAVGLTLDGKACKTEDLKAGTKIRVTTQGADKKQATRIEGLDKNPEFAANNRYEGKVVSIRGNKLVLTPSEGSTERTFTLADNAQVTCDGVACKPADLKAGLKIRVTADDKDSNSAIRVEALDKNPEFANR